MFNNRNRRKEKQLTRIQTTLNPLDSCPMDGVHFIKRMMKGMNYGHGLSVESMKMKDIAFSKHLTVDI